MADKIQQSNNSQLEALSAAINDLERKAQHVGTMSQKEKNILAGALLDAIINGLDLGSEPLLNMAVRRFKIMVEHGAWTEEFMGKIKAVCMVAIRRAHKSLLAEMVPVYQPILLNNLELRAEGIADLGMIACLAVKDGFDEIGRNCVKIILMMDRAASPEQSEISETALQILKNILITAARTKNEKTFCYALKLTNKSYQERDFTPDSALLSEFYLAVLFAAADHRWSKGLVYVNDFISLMLRKNIFSFEQKKKIAYEWIQLIGQIARRNWTEMAQQLMWFFFSFVLKSKERDILLYSVVMMGSSVKMHAAWENFESALKVYYPWQLAMFVLLDLFYKQEARENTDKLEVARLVVRTMRELVLHVSRLSLNKPETETFNRWFEVCVNSDTPKHVRIRARKMMQLTVLYWEQLQPKASKNQLPHLIKIFQPNLIDTKCKIILAE
ncbi:MAG: hypothetical protein AB7E34_06115 [Acidaminococcaceae bacterium]